VERELDRARVSGGEAGTDGMHAMSRALRAARFSAPRALMRAINATASSSTRIWTRAAGREALAAVADVGAGYSNLEYDLEAGERGCVTLA